MKTDRRVLVTKEMIGNAFVDLLIEKPIEKITVKELCLKARVNRSTYYRHYSDVEEVLKEKEDLLYKSVLESVKVISGEGKKTNYLVEIFYNLRQHKKLCKALLGQYRDRGFLEKIINIAHDRSIIYWGKEQPMETTGQLEKMYSFISNGTVAIIQDWVNSGMTESPEEIARFIQKASDRVAGLR